MFGPPPVRHYSTASKSNIRILIFDISISLASAVD